MPSPTSEAGAEVIVLSAGACKGLVDALAEQFTIETGAAITASFGAVGAMRDRLRAGEACDAVILTAVLIDELAQSGLVRRECVTALGSVRTGIAVRSGDRKPDIASRASLEQTLSAADAIYVPDTARSTAGIHVARMLRELGIDAFASGALREFPNGASAMLALAKSDQARPIGCTQATEILYTRGVEFVAPLPAPFELATVYALGLCKDAREPDLARTLADLLSSRVAEDIRRESGFDV